MLRALILVVSILVAAAGRSPALQATETASPQSTSEALPTVAARSTHATSASCAGTCQSRHDQCRVTTKGGPDCDNERHRCIESCVTRRTR